MGNDAKSPAKPAGAMPASTISQLMAHAERFHQAGDFGNAQHICQQVMQAQPGNPQALCILGDLASRAGNHAGAVELLEQALERSPHSPQCHTFLGNALKAQGDAVRAEACYREALRLDPSYADAHNNLGIIRHEQGQFAGAEHLFRAALQANSASIDAHSNLALSLYQQRKLDDAAAHCREALRLRPQFAEAHNNLAMILLGQGRVEEAVLSAERALAVKPGLAEAHCNLGVAHREQGRLEAARDCFETALRFNPAHAEARCNLAMMQLLHADFVNGWDNYEYRFRLADYAAVTAKWRGIRQPRAQRGDLAGKSILLFSEQGLGDTLQFMRYAPMLATHGARVTVECAAPVRRLFECVPAIARLASAGDVLSDIDAYCPVLSLPLLFGTTLENIPAAVPYLEADASLAREWAGRMAAHGPGFRVGLAWAGRPEHRNDRKRSVSLDAFAPLARLPGLAWYSLQKGEAARQASAPPQGMRITDLTHQMDDFADTAAMIANLDLVIAVDTSVAHLTGALGKPVWTLLPFVPDWRWLMHRADSPWYPTMRLFRQHQPGDWGSVMAAVASALDEARRIAT